MIVSLSTVDVILRTEDIEGLLALGAPEDEYSDEAAEIQAALEQLDDDKVTGDQISALVMDVWDRSFGPFSGEDIQKRQAVLQEIVRRILDDRFARVSGERFGTSSGTGAGGFSTGT